MQKVRFNHKKMPQRNDFVTCGLICKNEDVEYIISEFFKPISLSTMKLNIDYVYHNRGVRSSVKFENAI
jgi:hypothetical protein